MFAYCRNNPVCRVDISGTADEECFKDDELFSSDDLEAHGGGGGSWDIFLRTLQSAADGLSIAIGSRRSIRTEKHHILSDKHSKYTPEYKEIMERNNMKLSQKENIVELEGHRGRHTETYHHFMLDALKDLDNISGGNTRMFYEGFMLIVDFLKDNPWLPYAR